MKKEGQILLICIAGIGDLIMASKALRCLKRGYPDRYLHLLTSTEASILAQNYTYLDRIWAFPVRQLRKRQVPMRDISGLFRSLRKIEFELALNLYRVTSWQGALRMGLLMASLRAKVRVGHEAMGFGFFLDRKAPKGTFLNRHFTDAMVELAELAGGVPDEQGIEVFWDRTVETKWAGLISSSENKDDHSKLIGINPGSDRPQKRWNPMHYAYVADSLVEHVSAKVIILGGPGEEHIAQQIQSKMKFPSINLAGKLTLNDLVYVISKLDLLITNDSGPMHIGAAVKTLLVAIFGPEDPTYTRPYTSPDLYRIVYRELDCRPCRKQHCERPQCLALIEPEEVLEKCLELLK